MTTVSAVYRLIASLIACAGLAAPELVVAQASPATPQPAVDAQQRVLQQIANGASAREAIEALGEASSVRSIDNGRAADARQFDQAQQSLMTALLAFESQGGSLSALRGAYDAWRAAGLIVGAKITAEGQRLQQASAGAGYLARHQQAQARAMSAIQGVQALLDPVFAEQGASPAQSRAAASQALALLRQQPTRISEAPILRAYPLPFVGLNRPRELEHRTIDRPATYEAQTETVPTPQDGASLPYAPLNDEIVAQARALGNDYVRIYEFVRNTIRTEWYAGSSKGALGVLRSGAGNDVDQANLLTALLRATGIKTRYVRGVAELPLERLAAEVGLPASESALVPQALAKAGMAFNPIVRGGRVAAVELERVWVSAHVPYTNYRGALVDASGKTWIPLDASYKGVISQPSSGFFRTTFSAPALAAEYEARTQAASFPDFLRQRMTSALGSSGTAGTWESHRANVAIEPLRLDVLPNTLPYPVIRVISEWHSLEITTNPTVRIRLSRSSTNPGDVSETMVFEKTFPMADALNARVTLSYGPASIEDHRVALMYGGMDAVPLYLIGLRPELRVNGELIATGTERVEPGSTLNLMVVTQGTTGFFDVQQKIVAGGYHAFVFGDDPQRPAAISPSDSEHLGARLLDGLGVYYARAWRDADRDLAGWLDVGLVRPAPGLTIVSNNLRPALVAGVPVTFEWTGVNIDAALRPVDAAGARAAEFLALSALAGSSLERTVFRDQFAVEAVSADRGVQLANEQGIPVLTLTRDNLGSLDATNHSAQVKAEVRGLLLNNRDLTVRIPASVQTVRAWSGSVWQGFKEGRAGYFLSGGLAGGETVEPGDEWTLGFLADALRAMHTEEANNDPMSAAVVTTIGALQEATVAQPLRVPLSVLVRDSMGRPVRGAPVTYRLVAGDATLAGGASATVTTNALGMAAVPVVLGESTSVNSVWIMRNPDDEAATQVGRVVIDASVPSAAGLLQPSEPFDILALPDVMSQFSTLRTPAVSGPPSDTADILALVTADRFGNPIANVDVTVSVTSVPSCAAAGPPGRFRPAALWNASASARSCPDGLVLGLCGSPTLSLTTRSDGVLGVGVILANELGGTSTVTARAGGISRDFPYRANGTCFSSIDNVGVTAYLSTSGGEADEQGNALSAAAPGRVYNNPIRVSLFHSEFPYFVENNRVRFQPYLNWVPASGTVNNVQVTNGGSAAISGLSFTVRTGPQPGVNDSTVTANLVVRGVRNTSDGWEEYTEPRTVTGRAPPVFGVRASITGITSRDAPAGTDPTRVYLDGAGASMYPIDVAYSIEPAQYRNRVNGWIAKLLQSGETLSFATGDSQSGSGRAMLPRSIIFEPARHHYQAQLYTRHTVTNLESERMDLPMRQKLIASMSASGASRYVDVENTRACNRPGTVAFVLTQEARAAVTYQLLGTDDTPVGSPQPLVAERTYPRGRNEVAIDASILGSGRFEIVVNATAVADATLTDRASDDSDVRLQMSNSLPVGQVLVQGINVRNGILTHQAPRLGLAGRGNPFDFVVSYSSAAAGEISSAGANWVHNHDLGLTINSCGEVSVSAGDSGSVRFFPGPNGTMVPDKGYHGTLVANQVDNTWDFYSKDGTQYRYQFFNSRVQWKLVRVTDRNGNTQSYEYDINAFPDPLLSRVIRSDGRSLSFSYELRQILRPGRAGALPRSMLVRVEGNAGQRVALDYDNLGNLLTQSVNGRTTTFTYSTTATAIADRYRLLTSTDARGDTTEYTYQENPRDVQGDGFTIRLDHLTVSRVRNPMGGTMDLTIDPQRWLSSTVTTDPGGVTSYTFNAYGNPLTIADPAGTTTMTWDTGTDVLMRSKTDARNVRTDYDYDTQGNVTRETVDGASTDSEYEIQTVAPYSKSQLTSRTDRNRHTTRFELDPRGNVLAEVRPIGTIRHSYQSNGDRLSTTDANQHTTRFEYDIYGNQSAVIAPNGVRTETHRDARGRVDYIEDGRGNRTTVTYDLQDNPLLQVNARGDQRVRTFDALGNKLTERDEEGRTTTWSYFPGSLVRDITVTGPGGPAQRSFTYNGAGHKESETDWRGHTTTYAYDTSLRLDRRTEPQGKVTTYTYDEVGNLRTETTLDRVTTHTYDGMSRRLTTVDAEQHTWTNEYDPNGNHTAKIDPRNRRTRMVYDAVNRLREVHEPLGRSTYYAYDDAGNKTRETDPNGNVTEHRYDSLNRLERTIRADRTEVSFEYDEANNLRRQVDAGGGITQHGYDELNRKTSTRDPEGHSTTYSYDRVGNLTGERWANGNEIVHAYDLFNRRTGTTDSIGAVGAWEYDHNGNLIAETDGNGNRTTHVYNQLNHKTSSSLPGSRSLGFDPDVLGNVLESTDARGHRTTFQYDRLNRVVRTTYADGGVVRIAYDAAGNKRLQTDALEQETQYEVNDLNRVITVTDPLLGRIRSTYDLVGNLLTLTDKRDIVTEHRYDEMNRLRSTTKANLEIEVLTYTRIGQVETRTDANRNVTTYDHDRRGLVTGTRAPEGATTLTPRNAMGDVERHTDPEGRVTVTQFDERRRVRSVTNAANERTGYGYDLNNNKISTTRPSGAQTIYTIDHRNMLVGVSEPLSRNTGYGRDNNGNLTSVTDPNGHVTSYGYDTQNRRNSVTYPGGAAESFTHDRAGNLRVHLDANGVTVTRTYDALNRETDRAYSASADGLVNIVTTYDRNSNPETVTENYSTGPARITTTTYDHFDRPLTVQDGFGAQMVYTYDSNGNRRTLSTQDARITRYGFDGLNRLAGMSGPAGSVQYRYDRSGLTLEQTWSNGTSTTSAYDPARRPSRIQLSRAGAPLNLTEYLYDPNGNRTQERINRPGGAQLTTYRYDTADRLTGTLRVEGANSVDTTWTYDPADNRLSETVVTTGAGAGTVTRGYTYNPRNQLTDISDSAAGATTLAYDPQGNLLRKEQGSDTTNFVWSARDLLASVSRNGTVLGRYGSDHTGMRVSKEALNPLQPGAPPRVLRTQWDDENAVQDRDTTGSVIARYDFAGGRPIALWSQEDGNQLLHADALGSVIATTATDGSVKSETLYDAWGNPVLKAGISANKFAYTGHQADAETGLYYFKARYYDPVIGRFISHDPAPGKELEPESYHKYLYAYANPLVYVDPSGQFSEDAFERESTGASRPPAVVPVPVCIVPPACTVAPVPVPGADNGSMGRSLQRGIEAVGEAAADLARRAKRAFSNPVTPKAQSTPSAQPSDAEVRERAVALKDASAAARLNNDPKTADRLDEQIADLVRKHGYHVSPYATLPNSNPSIPGKPNNGPNTGITHERPGQGGVEVQLPKLEGKPADRPGRGLEVLPGVVPQQPSIQDSILTNPPGEAARPNIVIKDKGDKENLNSNDAQGNFGVYEIYIDGKLHKIGKADLERITKSSQLPTRLHQQVRKKQEELGEDRVGQQVVESNLKTTREAKAEETRRLQEHYDRTGEVPKGNEKSFKPKK